MTAVGSIHYITDFILLLQAVVLLFRSLKYFSSIVITIALLCVPILFPLHKLSVLLVTAIELWFADTSRNGMAKS